MMYTPFAETSHFLFKLKATKGKIQYIEMKLMMRFNYWVVLIMLITSCQPKKNSQQTESLPDVNNFYLYLLIGQSNMAGRGKIEYIDTTAHPRVYVLNQEFEWKTAKEPLHFDKPKLAGVGPGLTFGKAMAAAYPDATIGLIPCAVGGTSIKDWKKGAKHEQTQYYPYDDMLKRTLFALNSGILKGVIWHQGEADSKPGSFNTYEAQLISLIQQLRNELDLPELPFVLGTLGDFVVDDNPYADSINVIIQSIPKKVVKTDYVVSEGLTDKGDAIHFDSQSARELGEKYARAMLKLQ